MLAAVLICALGALVYSDSFFCSFHYDDYRFIVDNPVIRDIHNVPGIWHYWHSRFLVFLSLGLNYHFNGPHVWGYHLFNLGVHLGCAVLVWRLFGLTMATPVMKEDQISRQAPLMALLAGLVFVSHPVQTEAVTYVWQRAASMMTFFYLASVVLYAQSRLLQIEGAGKGTGFYIGALAAAVAAMFTKENAVTLPLMIFFYEYSFFKSKGLQRASLFPFFLTLGIVPLLFLTIKSQTFQEMHGRLNISGHRMTPVHYFLTQLRVMLTYIRLLFLPIHQNLDYDYPVFDHIFDLPVLAGILFLAATALGAQRLFLKYRMLSFSIFWFFLTLVIPESSFWAMGDVISEHRLYLPLAGYSLFLVSGAYYLLGKHSLRAMVIVMGIIIGFNSTLTYQRNKVWKDDLTLWNDSVEKSPGKARPYNNRGLALALKGDLPGAIHDFNKALEIDPHYADANHNLALALQKGRLSGVKGQSWKGLTDDHEKFGP